MIKIVSTPILGRAGDNIAVATSQHRVLSPDKWALIDRKFLMMLQLVRSLIADLAPLARSHAALGFLLLRGSQFARVYNPK